MLKIFHSATPLSLFFLFIYFAALSIHSYLQPQPVYFENLTPVAHILFVQWMQMASLSAEAANTIALTCIFLQGLLLSFAMQQFKIMQRLSLIPAVVFYLFCFLFDQFIGLYVQLFVNFLFIFLLFSVFAIYNKVKIDGGLFNIGLLISCILLLYFPAAAFILFCIYAILQLRSTSTRELFVFFSAIIVIFFLVATVFFWYNQLNLFVKQFYFPAKLQFRKLPDPVILVKVFICIILSSTSLLYLNSRYSANLIQTRKYFSCIIIYLIIAVLSVALSANPMVQVFFPALIPVAIITCYFLQNFKNREVAEITHIAFTGIVLLFQYINFAA